MAIELQNRVTSRSEGIDIAVIRLPRISNFDDFDPLKREPGVQVRYVNRAGQLGKPASVILPGSKSTMSDLIWLRQRGLEQAIRAYAQQGGVVVGICGGYQMLGTRIADPDHTESDLGRMDGMGLLSVKTTFQGEKATHQAVASVQGETGWLSGVQGAQLTGYEIHMGHTAGEATEPWLAIKRRDGAGPPVADGAVSEDGRIWGCYLHGLFQATEFRRGWLTSLGWQPDEEAQLSSLESVFDQVAEGVEAALDMEPLDRIVGLG